MKQFTYFLLTLFSLLFLVVALVPYDNFKEPNKSVKQGSGDDALKINNDLFLKAINFKIDNLTNYQKEDTLQVGQNPIVATLSLSLSTDSLPWILNETDSLRIKRIDCKLKQTNETNGDFLHIKSFNDNTNQNLSITPLIWEWIITPKEEGKVLLYPEFRFEIENKEKIDTVFRSPIKKYIHIKKEENPVIAQSRMIWNTLTRHLHLVFIASFFSLFGWYGKDIRLRLQPPKVHWKAANFDKHKKIAIICAHEDIKMADEFYDAFSIQIRRGYVDVWHQNLIHAGSVIRTETEANMNKADAIMVLLSKQLFKLKEGNQNDKSNYKLFVSASEICEKQNKILIPVLIEFCDWPNTSFESKQILAKYENDDKPTPITSKKWDNREHAITTVLEQINDILNKNRI